MFINYIFFTKYFFIIRKKCRVFGGGWVNFLYLSGMRTSILEFRKLAAMNI